MDKSNKQDFEHAIKEISSFIQDRLIFSDDATVSIKPQISDNDTLKGTISIKDNFFNREYGLWRMPEPYQLLRGNEFDSQSSSIQHNISQTTEDYLRLLIINIKIVYYEYFCLSSYDWKEVEDIDHNLGVYNSFNFFKKGDTHFSFGLIFSNNQVHIFIEARSSSLREVYVKNLFYSNQIIINDMLVDIRKVFDELKNYFETKKFSDEKDTSLLELL